MLEKDEEMAVDTTEEGYIDGAESKEKRITELEAQLTTKIINCIKFHRKDY